MPKFKTYAIDDLVRECGASFEHPVYMILKNLQYEDKMELSLEDGPWIAGGIITCLLTNQPIEHKQGRRDFDFWFASRKQFEVWQANYNFGQTPYHTDKADTYEVDKFGQKVLLQYIHGRKFSSLYGLLGSFDWSVCQFVTDGKEIVTTNKAVEDVKNGKLGLHYPAKSSNLPERFAKYTMQYGFDPHPDVLRRMIETIGANPAEFRKTGDSSVR